MGIKIVEDGPYLVSGSIPIHEMIITRKGYHYELVEGRALPQAAEYALCRCGASQNAPFCDKYHAVISFAGKETASRRPYNERIQDVTRGSTMDLLDDGRCAFARFCHSEHGNVWSTTVADADTHNREAAIKMANECPAGRLVMIDKEEKPLEQYHAAEIVIVQDPERGASAGIFVKGPIVIESADGTEYEVRNRVALCRCGRSTNMPFCDASHIRYDFGDGYLNTGS